MLVLLNEPVSTIFRGDKGGLDRVGTIVVIVFSINVWSFDLSGLFVTVWWFWICLILNGL